MLLILLLALAPSSPPASPTTGATELTLDRSSVAAVIAAQLPPPTKFPIPGLGLVAVELAAPREVQFVDGGVECEVGLTVSPPGLKGKLALRLVPEIDRTRGTIGFRAVRARPLEALSMLPDMASLIPPLLMPRAEELALGQGPMRVRADIQGVEVGRDRLTVKLGLMAVSTKATGTK